MPEFGAPIISQFECPPGWGRPRWTRAVAIERLRVGERIAFQAPRLDPPPNPGAYGPVEIEPRRSMVEVVSTVRSIERREGDYVIRTEAKVIHCVEPGARVTVVTSPGDRV